MRLNIENCQQFCSLYSETRSDLAGASSDDGAPSSQHGIERALDEAPHCLLYSLLKEEEILSKLPSPLLAEADALGPNSPVPVPCANRLRSGHVPTEF
jgi:hypothetical protein